MCRYKFLFNYEVIITWQREERLDSNFVVALVWTYSVTQKHWIASKKDQRQKKMSEYGTQLLEKQKVKAYYNLLERQFVRYYDKAKKCKVLQVKTCWSFWNNVLITLYIASALVTPSSSSSNGKPWPYFGKWSSCRHSILLLQTRWRYWTREVSRDNEMFKTNFQELRSFELPYIEKDLEGFKATFTRLPQREELPIEVNETLIVELYSK